MDEFLPPIDRVPTIKQAIRPTRVPITFTQSLWTFATRQSHALGLKGPEQYVRYLVRREQMRQVGRMVTPEFIEDFRRFDDEFLDD